MPYGGSLGEVGGGVDFLAAYFFDLNRPFVVRVFRTFLLFWPFGIRLTSSSSAYRASAVRFR